MRRAVIAMLSLLACSNDAPAPAPNGNDSGRNMEDAPSTPGDAKDASTADDAEWKSDAPRTLPDGAFPRPCNGQTGLWRIMPSIVLGGVREDEPMTAYIVDFDQRKVVGEFPMQYDGTRREYTVDVDPLTLPGQPSCAELPRYGAVLLTKSVTTGKYRQVGPSDEQFGGGSGAPSGCSAHIDINPKGAPIVEFYVWDVRGVALTEPLAMTPPESGLFYTLSTDMVPLCKQSIPDTVYIWVGRSRDKVSALMARGSFAF